MQTTPIYSSRWFRGQYGKDKKQSKYHNKKTADGFDSRKEKRHYDTLMALVRAGAISNLRRQVPYELIPAQYETTEELVHLKTKDKVVVKQECVERSVKYIADFVYTDNRTGKEVVVDTKGMRTADYIIKRKLMLFVHHIKIHEV